MKIILILTIITLTINASPREHIRDICKNIDSKVETKNFTLTYNSLNAYDRAKIKVSFKKKIERITERFHIFKFKSSEFKIGDYDFDLEAFPVIEIMTKDIKVKLKEPLFLRISAKNAKLIASKKEFGLLNLYLKAKFKGDKKMFLNNYCNSNDSITLDLDIYEYSLNCSITGAFFSYEKIKYNKKVKLVSIEIENVDKKYYSFIKKNLIVLNEKLERCYNLNKGSGIKFYTLEVSKDRVKVDSGSQTNISPLLEKCLDNQIKNYKYPILKNETYKVYFSVVLPNLKK
jgi:hypothetical protein